MITELEEKILEKLKLTITDWETVKGLMLFLREKSNRQEEVLTFLNNQQSKKLNQSIIVKKICEICIDE